ncbi:MAG: hypothetical protein EBR23_04095 [Planctomycetia bacterium]|jgi:hypothetical protein|nr:hypothetical protein [Planctomycetia bacterium]
MARRPHHRSIWEGTDRQSRAYHMAKLTAAVRVLVRLVRSLIQQSLGIYGISPALVLEARAACDEVEPYIEHAYEEGDE